MFHIILQENELVLKGLISSLLHLPFEEISSVIIKNPIIPGAAVDMKEFIDSVNISADSTTQFIDQIISLLEIPEISKMTFIPSQLVIDLGLMCKKGNTQLGEFEFDFTSLTEWYHSNISADYTWNYKSLHNRLVENDSKYKPKIVKTTKILKHITKNKDILESYLVVAWCRYAFQARC